MKLPEREHRMTKVYEMDDMSCFHRVFAKKEKVVHKKKVAAKKAAAPKTKKTATKLPVVPEVTLTRAESKKCDTLARTGSMSHKWQFVSDSGKWADYDRNASDLVEKAYSSWRINPEIDVRAVSSGDWAYQVDFNKMSQTNVRHNAHKTRKIQRVPRM